MNITEKILARASGRDSVSPGDVIFADVDRAMVHDVSGPGVIKVFDKLQKQGIDTAKLWDPSKVWVAEDHFVPSAEKVSAENIVKLENFTKHYGIKRHFKYGMGQYGICHTLSHEEALVLPGQVYVGGDSHTNTTGALGAFACGLGHTDIAYVLLNGRIWFRVPEALLFRLNGNLPEHVMAKDLILRIIGDIGTDGGAYKTMQFAGSGISEMSLEERLTLTNMTTEAGAKNGIIEPDQKTLEYLAERGATNLRPVYGDDDAAYERVFEYEASEIEPTVAKPFSPAERHDSPGGPVGPAGQGVHRLLHRRKDGGSGGGGRNSQGADCKDQDRDPARRDIHLQKGGGARTGKDILGCRRHSRAPDVRCVLRCAHGGAGKRRDLHQHHQQELSRKDGPCGLADVPCLAPGGGSIRGNGKNHRPEGSELRGKTIKYERDNIDTDVIIPGTYLKIHDYAELASHAMEGLDPDFHKRVGKGDFILAGKNFGCGSSREHAPIALSHSGISAVIALSFARIFYRNCVDGAFLLPIEVDQSTYRSISDGDELEIDIAKNSITNLTKNESYEMRPFSEIIGKIISAGGIFKFKPE